MSAFWAIYDTYADLGQARLVRPVLTENHPDWQTRIVTISGQVAIQWRKTESKDGS